MKTYYACATLFRTHRVCAVTSCADVMLPRLDRLARHAPGATDGFVGEPLQTECAPIGEGSSIPSSPSATHALFALSHLHIVLSPQVRWQQLAAAAWSGLIAQPFQSFLHKPLHPLVDKTTTDANRGSNVGDCHTFSQE